MDKYRILVVDDYQPTRNLITEALGQCAKYETAEAENGSIALELFKKYSFDLVISDVMMPQVSGMDLLPALIAISPVTPVIMMTAHTAPEMTVTALKNGAVDFLQKPFDIDELLFKVDIYLRNRPRCTPDAVQDQPQHLPFIAGMKDDLAIQQYIYDSIEQASGANEEILEKIVDLALKVVSGDTAYLLLYDQKQDEIQLQAMRSKNGQPTPSSQLRLWTFMFQEVMDKPTGLILHHEDHPEVSRSLICSPLMIRGRVFGLLVVTKSPAAQIFSRKELHYLQTITIRAALNLENTMLYESIYGNVIDTFQSLIASIEARDHYTQTHSLRVAKNALSIGRILNLPLGSLESLKIASLLHDIGKISIPDSILLKAGRLSPEEYQVMKNHSSVGESIIRPIALLDREQKIVRHHHERWDGAGYPDGLAGEEIPIMARILTVADSYDAIVTNRPYRQAMAMDWALEEIQRGRGSQFDPAVVDAFLSPESQAVVRAGSLMC